MNILLFTLPIVPNLWISFFCWTQEKIIWIMLVTKQLTVAIDLCIFSMPLKWIANISHLVPNILQNIKFCVQSYCAFTPDTARASKWPEVIHFQCEPAASSSKSSAACFGRWELKSSQLYGNELWRGWAATNQNAEVHRSRGSRERSP